MGKFKLAACGGTFDLFHAGHKAFLQDVLSHADNVLLGITSDLYVKSFKDGDNIESFKFRKNAVQDFLSSINTKDRVKISAIDNFYGPLLIADSGVQAIAVTPETASMAKEINEKRKQNNLPELEVILLSLNLAEDGNLISATRIRNGEINREGRLYLNPQWKNKTLVLPESLRSALQQPLAKILDEIPEKIDGAKAVTIGDITVQKFNQKNVNQFLSIIDFFVQRQVKFRELSELGFTNQNIEKVSNPHGTITPQLFSAIQKAFLTKNKKIIFVDGEEDLAFLPAMLIAPLGFSVFYGQPNQGLVGVEVTEENKERIYQIVSQFEVSTT
jgi:pantetheine-phosphate adenylyltransferase